jgi:hypothetical protein
MNYDHYFEKQTLKDYETSINTIDTLIEVYQSRMQKCEGVRNIIAYGNSIAQLQGAVLLLKAEGNFIQSEIKNSNEIKSKNDPIQNIPRPLHERDLNQIKTGWYMSTYDFVSENNLDGLAVNLFGQNWEAEDDVEQIEKLCNSVHSGIYKVECISEVRGDTDIRVTLK